jgi:hypothetical protein
MSTPYLSPQGVPPPLSYLRVAISSLPSQSVHLLPPTSECTTSTSWVRVSTPSVLPQSVHHLLPTSKSPPPISHLIVSTPSLSPESVHPLPCTSRRLHFRARICKHLRSPEIDSYKKYRRCSAKFTCMIPTPHSLWCTVHCECISYCLHMC